MNERRGGAASARRHLEENPFYVLGVAPDAARPEIEREGQKLLGMLELGLEAAASYVTPLGRRVRTAEMVRAALAELRDPGRRLTAELWARLPAEAVGRGVEVEVEARSGTSTSTSTSTCTNTGTETRRRTAGLSVEADGWARALGWRR